MAFFLLGKRTLKNYVSLQTTGFNLSLVILFFQIKIFKNSITYISFRWMYTKNILLPKIKYLLQTQVSQQYFPLSALPFSQRKRGTYMYGRCGGHKIKHNSHSIAAFIVADLHFIYIIFYSQMASFTTQFKFFFSVLRNVLIKKNLKKFIVGRQNFNFHWWVSIII